MFILEIILIFVGMIDNLDHLINNPSKSDTYDDVEKTIANQMARFTYMFNNTDNQIESLKTVCALGFDLWKTCGPRVCEDTNSVLFKIVRKANPDMAYQFQQIANKLNNNDVCTYLYLALPTIGNKVDLNSLKGLCYETIDKMSESYSEFQYPPTNFSGIDSEKVKSMYEDYLKKYSL